MPLKDQITLRQATASDSQRIAALHAASWRSAYRGRLSDRYLDNEIEEDRQVVWLGRFAQPNDRQYVVLAEQGTDLLGFVCVLLDEEPEWGACLDNLHIKPGFTGQGIGRQLFFQAVHWVTTIEPGQLMHLWVFADNQHARRFYERYGGTVADQAFKPLPGGGGPIAVRYVWHDLAALIANPPQ